MGIIPLLNKIVISDFNKKQQLIELVNKQDKNFYIVTTGIYDNIYPFWNKIYENITKNIPEKFNIVVHHYDNPTYGDDVRQIDYNSFEGKKYDKYLTIGDINYYQTKKHIIIDFAHLFSYGMGGKKLQMSTDSKHTQNIVYDNLNVVRTSYPGENCYNYYIYTTSKLFEVNEDGKVITLIDKIMKISDFNKFYEEKRFGIRVIDSKKYYHEPLEIIKYLMETYKGSNNTNKLIRILLEDKYAEEKNTGEKFFNMGVNKVWFMEQIIVPVINQIIELLWNGKNINDIYNTIYKNIK